MDKLDKLTIGIVVGMALYTGTLLALEYDPSQSEITKQVEIAAKQHVVTPELQNKINSSSRTISKRANPWWNL